MIHKILLDRRFLFVLLLVNLFGTIYGYLWYGYQLSNTPVQFLLFVPDSPTASLFFTIFLFFFIVGKNAPYVEALAIITLFKYGIWAVVMNGLTFIVNGSLPWEAYMLIVSHGAMAIQGLLYAPYYAIKIRHLVVASIWTLHNDIIDYVFDMMPVYSSLNDYMNEIGYFTFWLSIVSIALAYYLTVRKRLEYSYRS
ncbi:DUF1405 domain-containing protein [Aquibacillus sp. 3ASR75-11]|uniref:DUF1405 domain-containing protein n=1 Tax=Terrihalobacillus insolitus TaxID=2950438 RepID=A0A9X4ANR1_9BACI|nr:DUF1405 domain-containing protein [Terrihalobacillus insolitus]MDC3413038.1 DUF1405 domain-containing protein [Terrihalobacillus insolitus]MDC3424780.1 DUF1405 domain-containing protein [Terrihalobacillus insolitus]